MVKKSKKDKRQLREERRAAERRAERRRNVVTLGVVVVVLALGGLLVALSLGDDDEPAQLDEQELEDLLDDDAEVLEPDDTDEGDDGDEPDDAEDPEGDEGDEGDAEGGAEDDPDEDAGRPSVDQASGDDPLAEARADREVACDAVRPDDADEPGATYDEPEQVLEEGASYHARLQTSCGEVVVELDTERAPRAANSFAFLAEEGFYDGSEVFRSRPGTTMLQGGSGDGSDQWDVGYTVEGELDAAEQDGYGPGAVALATPEGDPDGGGSQFFVVYGREFMDAVLAGAIAREYPRFATVVEGMDVLRELGAIEVDGPTNDIPTEEIYIESVTIEEA